MAIKNFLVLPGTLRHIHDGKGMARSVNLFNEEDFETKLRYVSYTSLSPGVSIGYHEHDVECEEIYVILEGTGIFILDGEEKLVTTGDVIVTGIGQHHGLRNDSGEHLQLFVFWVEK